jgi:hypothetical protein
MNMQIVVAIACLVLLWVDPANAQDTKTYPDTKTFDVTVGRHKAVTLSKEKADDILAEASKVLKKCNVVLKRKDSVGTFTAPNPDARINNRADRDAVHRQSFDFKVVKIPFNFCRLEQIAGFFGCAWDPPPPPKEELPQHRSMIVGLSRNDLKHTGVTWAHEFGHRTGLPHRNERHALMACSVKVENVEINQHECDCLRGGPGFCKDPPEPAGACPIAR